MSGFSINENWIEHGNMVEPLHRPTTVEFSRGSTGFAPRIYWTPRASLMAPRNLKGPTVQFRSAADIRTSWREHICSSAFPGVLVLRVLGTGDLGGFWICMGTDLWAKIRYQYAVCYIIHFWRIRHDMGYMT